MKIICIDTDVWIDFLDAESEFHEKAKRVVEGLRNTKGVVSTLLVMEVNTGYYASNNADKAKDFKDNLEKMRNLKICDITIEISDKAAEIRARYGIATPDALVAATAMLNGAEVLYTRNLKHFLPLEKEGLRIVSP